MRYEGIYDDYRGMNNTNYIVSGYNNSRHAQGLRHIVFQSLVLPSVLNYYIPIISILVVANGGGVPYLRVLHFCHTLFNLS